MFEQSRERVEIQNQHQYLFKGCFVPRVENLMCDPQANQGKKVIDLLYYLFLPVYIRLLQVNYSHQVKVSRFFLHGFFK
jgi:hypothetical protein